MSNIQHKILVRALTSPAFHGFQHRKDKTMNIENRRISHCRMIRYSIITMAMAMLAACGQSAQDSADLTNEEIGSINSALSVSRFYGYAAASYANSYWSSPNAYFSDYTALGGDCTNFANQSILAGLANSADKKTVYGARLMYEDNTYSGNDWWYESDVLRAKPEWAGASGLYGYLRAQASHPTWAGIRVTQINSTGLPSAGTFRLGDIVSLASPGGAPYHSVVIVQEGRTYNDVYIAYRSVGGGFPANRRSVADYSTAYPGLDWNVFRISGFAK